MQKVYYDCRKCHYFNMRPDLSTALRGSQNLLGWELVHHTDQGDIGGIIVETEAYDETDEASHTFRGQNQRNAAMYQAPGTLYVYLIYGIHYCMNIVAGPVGRGEAVLIRALKPTSGLELMKENRGVDDENRLADGPAMLVQALAIPYSYNGLHITETKLELRPPNQKIDFLTSKRIGITKAKDKPWRFYI